MDIVVVAVGQVCREARIEKQQPQPSSTSVRSSLLVVSGIPSETQLSLSCFLLEIFDLHVISPLTGPLGSGQGITAPDGFAPHLSHGDGGI